MARARERGKTTGATFKITREQGIEFKRLVREGVRTGEICDKFGISPGSVYNYKRRLADWDETSDVWPPPEKEDYYISGREILAAPHPALRRTS